MLARVARKRIDRGHGHKHQEMDGKMPPGKALEAVPRFDLRTAVGGQQSSQSLGCSKPLVAGVVVHVVLNEHMASGGVRNHFVKASLDPSLSGSAGGGGADSGWRAWSWCSTGTRPIRAIHGLDDECHTLIYTQGGRFRFATGPAEQRGNPSSSSNNAAGMAIGGGFPGMAGTGAGSGGVAALGGAGGGGGGGGGVGAIFESLPVHSGSIVDFRVNPFSRDIVSGCDHGHAHVLNFSPDMVGVPTMKVSKYVAQPLSSARWGKGSPYMASWTSSKGLLQMLDTRDYRMVSSTQVEGGLVHTHEYISDMVLAVGCGVGCVQLFDVRKMEAFVTLEDTVAGSIHQILSSTGGDSLYAGAASPSPSSSSSGVKDWVALGTAGVSRYSVGSEAGNTNGSSASAGAGAGVSPGDGDELVRFTARMSYAAGCRIVDLNLPIGLDMNAGLFVIPPHSSEPQQLCGITVDSRIVAFTSPSPSPASGGGGGGGGGVGANGSTAPTFSKQTAVGMDVGNAAGSGSGSGPGPSSLRAMSPVAPVDGSTVAGSGGGHGTGGIDAGAGGGGGGGEISKSAAVTAADGFGRAGEEGSVGTRPAAGK